MTTQKYRAKDWIASILFLGSLFLLIISIHIYRETFIDWRKLIIPTAIGAIIFTIIFYKKFNTVESRKWGSVIVCILSGSSIVHFGMMSLNKTFADKEVYSVILPIIHKGELPKGSKGHVEKPYVTIDFNGLEKRVMINWKHEQNADYSKLYIEYSIGRLGYYVIRKKQLVE